MTRPCVSRVRKPVIPDINLCSSAFICGSYFFVEDLAELLADLLDLRFVDLRVYQIQPFLAALEPHRPDFPIVLPPARLVNQHALAHEDQAKHETEVELGG